jgi:solute carrier family 30 (zinc transporter), member 1
MLNDVFSLCVGLWAVHVKNSRPSKQFTYGWQTAETLGALINGVFLVALCMSIGLEAIERMFNPPEITNPQWILGVGSAGLAMNILGLFLFHDHSHSHGHGHDAEHGRDEEEGLIENGDAEDSRAPQSPVGVRGRRRSSGLSSSSPVSKKHRSLSRGYNTLDGIATHPASLRNDIINASRLNDTIPEDSDSEGTDIENAEITSTAPAPSETTPLIHESSNASSSKKKTVTFHGANGSSSHRRDSHSHSHKAKSPQAGHGHSHGDLNMRAVFLHVLGDALGNIGVIATALFIWLTPYSWRFYSDPVISLLIACIILASAIPLCRAASRILLLAVPTGVSVDDIKADVLGLPGVVSCHHVHVWQLSDTTLVASLHVRVACKDASSPDGASTGGEYMELARLIRRTLHGHGIHSTTIQPEFCLPGTHQGHTTGFSSDDPCGEEDTGSERGNGKARYEESTGCLMECGDECGDGATCCRTGTWPADGGPKK